MSVLRDHSVFFIPATTANDFRLRRIFYTRSNTLHYFLILILQKEPVILFSMLSAKQGNYWYHFYNVFGMTWGLNPGPPALDAGTLPLGYRGGGWTLKMITLINVKFVEFTNLYIFICTPVYCFTILNYRALTQNLTLHAYFVSCRTWNSWGVLKQII